MRGPEDLIKVQITMSTIISLDRERIVNDPIWAEISENINIDDEEQIEQALYLYLASYIKRQQLFGGMSVFMPSTNGPSDIEVINMKEIKNGSSNSSSNRDRSKESLVHSESN